MQLLGRGASAHVFLDYRNRRMVALKKVKLHGNDGVNVSALREARILNTLHYHPSIVQLYNTSFTSDACIMELEFLSLSLRSVLIAPIVASVAKMYAKDLISGLEYCHAHSIMHRDIKPENLMIDGRNRLKLVDFGLARETVQDVPDDDHLHTPQMITLWYRAPEVLLAKPYGTAVDIWSAGCVMAEMITGVPLFRAATELDMLVTINDRDPHSLRAKPEHLHCVQESQLFKLISACLTEPHLRITAEYAYHIIVTNGRKRPRSFHDGNR